MVDLILAIIQIMKVGITIIMLDRLLLGFVDSFELYCQIVIQDKRDVSICYINDLLFVYYKTNKIATCDFLSFAADSSLN